MRRARLRSSALCAPSVPSVAVRREHRRATVVISGPLGPTTATEARAAIRDVAALGAEELVVDLLHAEDAALLLPALARSRAEVAERGGVLRLEGVALPEFLDALIAAPLDEVFLVYDAVRGESRRDAAPGSGASRARSVQRSTGRR